MSNAVPTLTKTFFVTLSNKTFKTSVNYFCSNYKNYNANNQDIKIDDLKLPKIDFVKIDIQGAEHLALKGMKKILNKDRPYFFIEIENFYLLKMNSSNKKLINLVLKKFSNKLNK